MPDRSRKRKLPHQGPEDANEMAAGILAAIPGALDDEDDAAEEPQETQGRFGQEAASK